jgi:hypothetical protein
VEVLGGGRCERLIAVAVAVAVTGGVGRCLGSSVLRRPAAAGGDRFIDRSVSRGLHVAPKHIADRSPFLAAPVLFGIYLKRHSPRAKCDCYARFKSGCSQQS